MSWVSARTTHARSCVVRSTSQERTEQAFMARKRRFRLSSAGRENSKGTQLELCFQGLRDDGIDPPPLLCS